MKNQVSPKSEIILCVSLIIFSGIVYYFALELPDPEYEPLGSAALPKSLSVIMSILSLIVIFRAIPRIKNYKSEPKINTEVISRPKLSIIIFIR